MIGLICFVKKLSPLFANSRYVFFSGLCTNRFSLEASSRNGMGLTIVRTRTSRRKARSLSNALIETDQLCMVNVVKAQPKSGNACGKTRG
jgi:hypothetical protein